MGDKMESYNTVLGRMSGLTDLANHIETITKGKNEQTAEMLKVISEMSKHVNNVRENVDKIKAGNVAVSNRLKEVINSSEDTQKANLEKIKANITTLGNVSNLDTALKSLDKDIGLLVEKAMGPSTGPSTGPSSGNTNGNTTGTTTGNTTDNTTGNNTSGNTTGNNTSGATFGGYTYGKSRKKGKGRRKRTKKSRRKGSKRR